MFSHHRPLPSSSSSSSTPSPGCYIIRNEKEGVCRQLSILHGFPLSFVPPVSRKIISFSHVQLHYHGSINLPFSLPPKLSLRPPKLRESNRIFFFSFTSFAHFITLFSNFFREETKRERFLSVEYVLNDAFKRKGGGEKRRGIGE